MRILGVVKSRVLKILKLTFTGSVINEASTASNTIIALDPNTNLTGGVLNLDSSSSASVKISQSGGNDWFNLQRDFDLTFNLVINAGSPVGEIITIEDNSENSVFRLDYNGSGVLRVLHGGSPNFTQAVSSAVTTNVSLPIKLEYRRTSVKLFVNEVAVIDVTGWLKRDSLTRELWLGGSGASNTILGSLDDVEMTLFL